MRRIRTAIAIHLCAVHARGPGQLKATPPRTVIVEADPAEIYAGVGGLPGGDAPRA